MSKFHVLMGKRVPVDRYDTDHLLRLILKISKRCNKFALKHTKSVNVDDNGVWVARGFVKTMKSKNGHNWEISTTDKDPLIVTEKFLTMLTEHEEIYGVKRERLDPPKGGICLDPFNGSGTTGIACKLEGMEYVGIELDPEYVKISEARIEAWQPDTQGALL